MKKLIGLLLVVVCFIFIMYVDAVGPTTPPNANMTFSQCQQFHGSRIVAQGSGHFPVCIQARCLSNRWNLTAFNNSPAENMITCSNGNRNFFTQIVVNGCAGRPQNSQCSYQSGQIFYCNQVVFYDCNRTAAGAPFTPTTQPPLTTRPVTTTTTRPNTTTTRPPQTTTTTRRPTGPTTQRPPQTTTQRPQSDNNFLRDLSVYPGEISFNPLILNYILIVEEGTTSVAVTAVADDESATVTISNHEEINVEVPIEIRVTAENGETRVYTINVVIHDDGGSELSSNSRLRNITIEGYVFNFTPGMNDYTLHIERETSSLNITVTPEDENATYTIAGNINLANRGRIIIEVRAEDGSTSTYTINITQSGSNAFIGVIIVIIVLGVAGFVGFKLVKQMLNKKDEGTSHYEYE